MRAASSARSAICARKSATSPPAIACCGRTRTGAANDAAIPRYQCPALFHPAIRPRQRSVIAMLAVTTLAFDIAASSIIS